MFLIANFLDSAKAKAGIASDYRLAKLIDKNTTAISNYRAGRSLPNDDVIVRICELSGDDAGIVIAEVNAARTHDAALSKTWLDMARRLRSVPRQLQAGFASLSMMLVIIAISLLAAQAGLAAQNGNLFAQISAALCVLCKVAKRKAKRFLQAADHWMPCRNCAYA